MLFNSFEFILAFLPITLVGYFWLRKNYGAGAAHVFLAFASLVFYAYWDIRMLPVLLFSIVANYAIAGHILRSRSRALLAIAIVGNLLALGYYKYAGFVVTNINELGFSLSKPDVVLPLGISFFTFTQITYLVDAYHGRVREHSPISFCLFVSFFPHLICGPLLHHRQMMPQFYRPTAVVRSDIIARGLFLFIVGMFKKVVIADSIAPWADTVFASADAATWFDAWVGAIAYALQLYFDFSGYSEMAMGLALLFGIRLPKNFDSPYRATNIRDFWRRWHMTLSALMRDYLYVPLGGSRSGRAHMLLALIVTMLIGGLWHGAAWTFVAWGALHGLFLIVYTLWRDAPWRLPKGVAHALTLVSVTLAWVLFRATSFSDAIALWRTMLGMNGLTLPSALESALGMQSASHASLMQGHEIFVLAVLVLFVASARNVHYYCHAMQPNWRYGALTVSASLAGFAFLTRSSSFLYFNF